mgnify:CR=1 FL=1
MKFNTLEEKTALLYLAHKRQLENETNCEPTLHS